MKYLSFRLFMGHSSVRFSGSKPNVNLRFNTSVKIISSDNIVSSLLANVVNLTSSLFLNVNNFSLVLSVALKNQMS